jgi:hypothetical protein
LQGAVDRRLSHADGAGNLASGMFSLDGAKVTQDPHFGLAAEQVI